MERNELKNILESILFVAEKPVSIKEMAQITGQMITEIQNALSEITKEFEARGISLVKKGEYFSFISNPANASFVGRFLNEELRHDLSQAALETLAVITYKQPITKAEVEEIRGVNSDQMVRNLMIRGLIGEVGRKETPGRPILYGTTMEFIQYFGLLSEEGIPKIEELSLFNKTEIETNEVS